MENQIQKDFSNLRRVIRTLECDELFLMQGLHTLDEIGKEVEVEIEFKQCIIEIENIW